MDFKELDKRYNDLKNTIQEIEDIHLHLNYAFTHYHSIKSAYISVIKKKSIEAMIDFEKQHKFYIDELDKIIKKLEEDNANNNTK